MKLFSPFHLFLLLFECIIAVYGCTLYIDYRISRYENACYSSTVSIPHNIVGLVLGTSKHLKNGRINLYYSYRIRAVRELYHAGKIDHVLVSGDNSSKQYNEPETFKADLIRNGIPAENITLDYAGFSTLDSVIRCKKVFKTKNATIISQPFHNERALFLAHQNGLRAIGYNAKDISGRLGLLVKIREKAARLKAALDTFIFSTQPTFLGEEILLPVK